MPEDISLWPTVDVYVPTYNEPMSIVRATVLGAIAIDWPPEKLRIYLLDDGRREEFREFAAECGIGYITRGNNLHAKAGNLNNALSETEGEFIAVFDSDHIPTRAFLQMTMGWMINEPRNALVQTPHHFYSPDPFQRNLAAGTRVPAEGNMFLRPGAGRKRLLERRVLLRLVRRAAPCGAGGDRRVRGRDGDRGRAYDAQDASPRVGQLLSAAAAGGGAGNRAADPAHRPACALGARHDPDLPHRQPAVRAGSERRAAYLLPAGDGAFLLCPATDRVPDGAARLPAVRPEHHRGVAAGDRVLRPAAHLPLGGDQLASAAQQPALVLVGDLRDGVGAVPRPGDGGDAVRAAAGQVQRHEQGRPAGEWLFRPWRGVSEPDPCLLHGRRGDTRPGRAAVLPNRAAHVPGIAAEHDSGARSRC